MAGQANRDIGRERVLPTGARGKFGATSIPKPPKRGMRIILGNFAHALSIAVVCRRSLAALQLAAVGDEEEALREAIRLLRLVYTDLDQTIET